MIKGAYINIYYLHDTRTPYMIEGAYICAYGYMYIYRCACIHIPRIKDIGFLGTS